MKNMQREVLRSGLFVSAAATAILLATPAKAELIYGLTTANNLVTFDSATPGTTTAIGPVTGILGGHTLRAIDFRPATGELFAVSTIASSTTGVGQVYTINTGTGAATAVGSTFSLLTTSTRVSIDFNPTVDRIRLVTGTGENLRLNPLTGAIAGTDTNLSFDPSSGLTGTPFVAGAAYTNNFAGATTTTMYVYEFNNDRLMTQGGMGGSPSPNGGALFNIGSTGVVATSAGLGFDISGTTGVAYMNIFTGTDGFYTANLATGAVTLVGNFSTGMLDISAAPAAIPEPATMALLGLGALALRRRSKRA